MPNLPGHLFKTLAAVAMVFCVLGAAAQNGKTEILWLGQASVRITTPGGKVIMIDPWLRTNPKTPAGFKTLEALGRVDLVLVTHGHFDHIADAPDLARLNNAPIYNAGGLGQTLVTLGVVPAHLVQRFGMGGTVSPFGPDGIKITGVQAVHASEYVWRNLATNKEEAHYGGEAVGYIIEMENGFKVYHMGDTGLFGDMKLIGEYYKPDVVLIPIGGHFVMNPADAAFAVRNYLKPRYALPIHYGTIPVLRGTPEEFASGLGDEAHKMLQVHPGEKVDF